MIGNNLVLALGTLILNWQLVFWDFFLVVSFYIKEKKSPQFLPYGKEHFLDYSFLLALTPRYCYNQSLLLNTYTVASSQIPTSSGEIQYHGLDGLGPRLSHTVIIRILLSQQLWILVQFSIHIDKWLLVIVIPNHRGFSGGSEVKSLPANAGDVGLIPGLRQPPGGGNSNPLQHSCLENPMDRGV